MFFISAWICMEAMYSQISTACLFLKYDSTSQWNTVFFHKQYSGYIYVIICVIPWGEKKKHQMIIITDKQSEYVYSVFCGAVLGAPALALAGRSMQGRAAQG